MLRRTHKDIHHLRDDRYTYVIVLDITLSVHECALRLVASSIFASRTLDDGLSSETTAHVCTYIGHVRQATSSLVAGHIVNICILYPMQRAPKICRPELDGWIGKWTLNWGKPYIHVRASSVYCQTVFFPRSPRCTLATIFAESRALCVRLVWCRLNSGVNADRASQDGRRSELALTCPTSHAAHTRCPPEP